MKKNLNRTLMLTAAVLTLGAAAAYGQDALIAKVPFSFQVRGTNLPAGQYAIGRLNGGPVLQLSDSVSGKAELVIVQSQTEGASSRARLIFKCGDLSGCSLAEVWNGSGNGWRVPTRHFSRDEQEHVAVVFLNGTVGQ